MIALALAVAPFLWLAPPASAPSRGSPSRTIEAEPRQYRAVRTVDPIVVDGKGDEATWARAPFDDRFSERTPTVGAPPPVRTRFKVAYDDTNLYVLVDCENPPGDIVVRTLRRDNGGIFADDDLVLKIDAAHNHRDAVSLGINADGAQIDSLGLDDGAQFITEWDAVWYAETTKRSTGWTAEFRVPFAILGIKNADDKTFGFNITRDHSSRNATYDWALIVPPRSPMAASQFGDLVGLRNVRAQRAVEYSPYALVRSNFRPTFTMDPRRAPNIATGADVRAQIGAASYVEGTYLTDFAQVEADDVQVARDRFPLFFPERRPFFINGLDVFTFGRQGEAQLFFTRRVGLVDGGAVPILAGAKVYGRAGRVQYGALNVQTLGRPHDDGRGLLATDPENVGVGRVRVQAAPGVAVGAIVLGRQRLSGQHDDDAAAGVDARVIGLGGRLQYYGFVAGSYAQTPGTPAELDERTLVELQPATDRDSDLGASASSSLEYRGLYVRPNLAWLWSDSRFDPRLGFYRRPGSARHDAGVSFVPRPRVLGLQEIAFGPGYTAEIDPTYDDLLSHSGNSNLRLLWNNGAAVAYNVLYFVDDLQAPFDLYLHTIEARRYRGFRHLVHGNTPSRRAVSADATYEWVELFGGVAHQPAAGVSARIGKHFAIGARYTHLVGHFADRDARFDFGFANANLDIAINRNLAFDNLGRLDLSPGNERVGLQSRLRWRFLPGSDLFLVYRANLPVGATSGDGPAVVEFHELTLKFTVYLRAFVDR